MVLSHMVAGLKYKFFYLLNYLIFSAFSPTFLLFSSIFLSPFLRLHFPTQKCLKIFPNTSSVCISPPVISPRW